MNLALYAAASGMDSQQLNLSNISNNIANVNTTGFKRQKIEFQDMLYQNMKAPGADAGNGVYTPTGISVGNGTRVASTARVFTQGELSQTDVNTDMAINGNGFIEIQMADGSTAYTRDGGLKISSTGQWVNNDGLLVLSGFQQVATDYTDISISKNGYVTVESSGGSQTFQVQLTRFPNPAGLKALGANLYAETQSSGSAETGNPSENGFGSLQQGYLEMSNVDVVDEMVNMIVTQRAYEINSKSVQTADNMLAQIAQLKR